MNTNINNIKEYDNKFKILILGDDSEIIFRIMEKFSRGKCNTGLLSICYPPYIRNRFGTFENKRILLELWLDTFISIRFPESVKEYNFNEFDMIILTYNVSMKQSFKKLKKWLSLINERLYNIGYSNIDKNNNNNNYKFIPIYLIGDFNEKIKCEETISYDEGKEMSKEFNCLGFEQISILTDNIKRIENLFIDLTLHIMKHQGISQNNSKEYPKPSFDPFLDKGNSKADLIFVLFITSIVLIHSFYKSYFSK